MRTATALPLAVLQLTLVGVGSSDPPTRYLDCGDHVMPVGDYWIQSPDYPSHYGTSRRCTYQLSAGSGVKRMAVQCSRFDIEHHAACSYDYLRVEGVRYCSGRSPSVSTDQQRLTLEFRSDDSVGASGYLCTIQARPADPSSDRTVYLIHNDTDAPQDKYPWQARIVLRGSDATKCGGSLLSSRFVVTAAHCVPPSDRLEVRLGSVQMGRRELRYSVLQRHIHPLYTTVGLHYDVALLQLSRHVPFSDSVRPVRLPRSGESYTHVLATVSGFGLLAGARRPGSLRQLQVITLSQRRCRSFFPDIGASHICAGQLVPSDRGTCSGDSGGPLVAMEGGRHVLVGVVSFGALRCGKRGYPDVYARVTQALPFIKHIIKRNHYP